MYRGDVAAIHVERECQIAVRGPDIENLLSSLQDGECFWWRGGRSRRRAIRPRHGFEGGTRRSPDGHSLCRAVASRPGLRSCRGERTLRRLYRVNPSPSADRVSVNPRRRFLETVPDSIVDVAERPLDLLLFGLQRLALLQLAVAAEMRRRSPVVRGQW